MESSNEIRNFQELLNIIESNLDSIPSELMEVSSVRDLQNCRTSMANTCCHNRMAVLHNCNKIYSDLLYSIPENKENLNLIQSICHATGKSTSCYVEQNLIVDIQH